jgi:hypothetical protein
MRKIEKKSLTSKLILLAIFATAMGYFEAAVVVYLRRIFYPDGFSFPLVAIDTDLIAVEIFRELSTIIMLAAVATVSAKRFWERFGVFVYIFGIWDIFYYVWLKVILGWPVSLLDWDVLFLVPIPWIGPVIAPCLVSVLMIMVGFYLMRLSEREGKFRVTSWSWLLGIIATATILFSFMWDLDATLRLQMPKDYMYSLLATGLILYAVSFVISYRRSSRKQLPEA